LRQVASIENLKRKYADRDVAFVVVYVEDPHPGEPGFRNFRQPESSRERIDYAKQLVSERAMGATVVVDGMDNRIWEQFGSLPNMVYVTDRDGTVAYHATWTIPNQIDRVLSELTTRPEL